MRYSLVVNYKGKSFEINNYAKALGFDDVNESKLKDIVELTNEFDNERDLIDLLIYLKILPKDFSNGKIGINYYKSKTAEPKLLQYGLSFKEDKKFFDTIFLKYYFCEKLTNDDFMKLFLNKYFLHLKDVFVFAYDLDHIRFSYEYYKQYQTLPKDAEESMTRFVEVYCRKKSKDGYYKADFTRIRDLAMFAINYERQFVRKPKTKTGTTLEDLEMLKNHYEVLLQNDTLSDEERNMYIIAIKNIQNKLELDNIHLSRRM